VRLDNEARAAIKSSNLGSLSPAIVARLVEDALPVHAQAGSLIHHEGNTSPHLEVVVSGLVRVYVTAPDGRTMTVRYCRLGALIGMVSLFADRFSNPAAIQAVTDAELIGFRPATVRAAADLDPKVARALLNELSERVVSFIAEIRDSTFPSVRQRVARHLLDLASEEQKGSELVAAIGQQDLADAVGTVREVVVRALREFRRRDLIDTGRDRIRILDPEGLLAEADLRMVAASRNWNQSP
jgi:CRP/FNR family transcriptional regulator, cyclic AMP receptor protein